MIYIKKNFLETSLCQKIISFYDKKSSYASQYRDTFPLSIYHGGFILENEYINQIINKITFICTELNNSIKLDMCQIVKWKCGSKQGPHYDPPNDVFACIIYLNSDYNGGETCFENFKVIPEVGKLVIFTSSSMLHWVQEVEKTNRYTLALWYIKNN